MQVGFLCGLKSPFFSSEDIVGGSFIKIGKLNEYVGGNVAIPFFVAAALFEK